MIEKHIPNLSKYSFRSDGEVISRWGKSASVLRGGVDKDGYRKFVLIDDFGNRRYFRRSHLICTAFHGPRPVGKEVRHLDGSRDNDAPDNLSWSTHAENCLDKRAHGTAQRGSRNTNTKISQESAMQIKRLWANGASTSEVVAATGATRSIVFGIKYGKSWAWLDAEGIAAA